MISNVMLTWMITSDAKPPPSDRVLGVTGLAGLVTVAYTRAAT